MSGSHSWLLGAVPAGGTPASLGHHDGHPRLRGPYTAANSVLRAIVPTLLADSPELAQRHDVEILTAAPELGAVLENRRPTLTSAAAPADRTRFYPHDRVVWLGNGLTDLLLAHAARLGGGQTLLVTSVDRLDHTDSVWLAGLLRRADPAVLRLVLASESAAVAEPLAGQLARHAVAGVAGHLEPRSGHRTAADHVRGCCLSGDPARRAAYESLVPARRALLHDAEADRLAALADRGEHAHRLGAIPFHRERGSDPGAAVAALAEAQTHCLLHGFYHQVVELGRRLRQLLRWDTDHEAMWLATVKMTTAHQSMGRPDEAMALYDEACAHSVHPGVHMQAAYGRAMIHTRYLPADRRDLNLAKGLVNTAVALASMSPERQRQDYYRTFNENGLALVEMHLGNPGEAGRLIEDGLRRLDALGGGGEPEAGPEAGAGAGAGAGGASEFDAVRTRLHRSVLRYNHAQLTARAGHRERAVEEYTRVIADDPNHPDYYVERAGLLESLGRLDEALADYTAAIRVAPPYPVPHYNRADLRARLGDLAGAEAEFSRVLELDPDLLDAYVNRAGIRLEAGDPAGAERDVDAGLQREPGHPHLLCLRGLLHLERGSLEQAQSALAAAVAADDQLAGAWANLGATQYELGLIEQARHSLERSLALDDDPAVRENLALLPAAA